MPKLPPSKFDVLSDEEGERLRSAVRGDPQRFAMIVVGLDAGLRQGELLELPGGATSSSSATPWACVAACRVN